MPRVDIPITDIAIAGVAPPAVTVSDATNGHELASNDGSVFLEVENVGASSRTVTIVTQAEDVDGLALPDRVLTIPAGESRKIGRIKPSTHNVRSGADQGKVYIDPEVSTDLEFRAWRLPQS